MPSEKFNTQKLDSKTRQARKNSVKEYWNSLKKRLSKENTEETTGEWIKKIQEKRKIEIEEKRKTHSEGMEKMKEMQDKITRTDNIPTTFQAENTPSDLTRPDLIFGDKHLSVFLRVAAELYRKSGTIYPLSGDMPREKYILYKRMLKKLYKKIDEERKQ